MLMQHLFPLVQEEHDEKVHLVDIYNQRLTERETRRTHVISRGLLDIKRTQVCLGPFTLPVLLGGNIQSLSPDAAIYRVFVELHACCMTDYRQIRASFYEEQ